MELGLGLMFEPQGARAASVVLVCSFFLELDRVRMRGKERVR